MTTLEPALPTPPATARRTPLWPALLELTRAELRRLIRNPMFAIGTIGFPIMFFALFGLPLAREVTKGGVSVGQLILVNFAAYSLLSLAMFSFGANVAVERTGGWLRLLRASPMSTAAYFTAKIAAALVFSAVAVAALYAFGHFAGGITLSAGLAVTLLLKLLVGMIPLIAMGLCIGFLARPAAAQVVANIVSVIMSFTSGLFMPLENLPDFVRKIAPAMPPYHLGQVLNGTVAGSTSGELGHWLVLAAFTAAFGMLAAWGFKRDESRDL